MRYHLYIMCFYQIADFFSISIDLFSIVDFQADFLFVSISLKDVDATLHGGRQKQEPQASPFALSDWNFSLLLSLY